MLCVYTPFEGKKAESLVNSIQKSMDESEKQELIKG